MHVLFVTDRAYLPQAGGGSQRSADALLRRLATRGHRCELAATLAPGPWQLTARLAHAASRGRRHLPADTGNGYPVHRAAPWHLGALLGGLLARGRPDVIIVDSPHALALVLSLPGASSVPVVWRVADLASIARAPRMAHPERVMLVANSDFCARRVAESLGGDVRTVYPIVETERVLTPPTDPAYVTLVSPLRIKGLDLTLAIARLMPTQPFLLQEGWRMSNAEWQALEARVAPLRNVTIRRFARDVRPMYANTRVLLIPSRCEEAFGRVAVEAQANGIPVFATRVGGLPESVGDGGRLFELTDPASTWAVALGAVLSDATQHAALSERARRNAERPEFAPEAGVVRFEGILEAHVAAWPATHAGPAGAGPARALTASRPPEPGTPATARGTGASRP